MFITNELNPGEMLAELFRGRRVPRDETSIFDELRHDRDLCPRFAHQINTMLDVYRAYGHEVHDTQSPRDDGIDVLLRYSNRKGEERRAGFQIKSEDEFRQWEARKLPLMQILKAQHASALANVHVDDYYILLCVDAVRHQKRIRTVCSEMKNFRPCTIVEPIDLVDFYEMDGLDLWGRTTRLLCQNDRVLKMATDETNSETPDFAFFLIRLVYDAFGGLQTVLDKTLFEAWSDWEDFANGEAGHQDRLADILSRLLGTGILSDEGADYRIVIDRLPVALCALYFDLRVRVLDDTEKLRLHILNLVDLKSRLSRSARRRSRKSRPSI